MGSEDALYVAEGEGYLPTPLTQGPWAPGHQFGGAPAALMATCIEDVPSPVPMRIARLTVDLLRPVPISPIEIESSVRREGRRIQVVDLSLRAEGREVARAAALRVRVGDLGSVALAEEQAPEGPWEIPLRPAGDPEAPGAMECACPDPDRMFLDPTWVRLRVPVVAGWPTSPVARMAYVADCASGFGHPRGAPLTGINADLTMSVVRYARGEWLCLSGTGWTGREGIGVAQTTLSDHAGVVASVVMSRLVDPA